MAPVTRNQKTLKTTNDDKKAANRNKILKVRPVNVNKQNPPTQANYKQSTGKDGLPIIAFPSQSDLEDWLQINHTITTGLWVKIAKKSSGIPTVTYEEMLDAALCYGWIDGQRNGMDDTWFLQRITPRRPKSNWSQVNREKVKRLIRVGKMQSAGQNVVDAAKADGRWDNASKPSSGFVVPDELVAALEESSDDALKSFAKLNKTDKLALINRFEQTDEGKERSECIRSIVLMRDMS